MVQVKVTIRPDGETVVEGIGFEGTACTADVDAVLRAMDQAPKKVVKKDEKVVRTQTRAGTAIKGGNR